MRGRFLTLNHRYQPGTMYWFFKDPRKTKLVRLLRKHISFWLVYTAIGAVFLVHIALEGHDYTVTKARQEAYETALRDFNKTYKEQLLGNKDFLSKACYTWWFDLTGKDRDLIPNRSKGKTK